jgi:hypothetical protein
MGAAAGPRGLAASPRLFGCEKRRTLTIQSGCATRCRFTPIIFLRVMDPLAFTFARPVHVAAPSATAVQALHAAKAMQAAAVLVREHGRAAALIPVDRLECADPTCRVAEVPSVPFARMPPDTPAAELLGAGLPWFLLSGDESVMGVVAADWVELPGGGSSVLRGGGKIPKLDTFSYHRTIPEVFGPVHVAPPRVIYRCPLDPSRTYDFATSRQHLSGGEVVCEDDGAVMVPERQP